MKIERDKWYVMRNGEKVRVVCVDADGERPVITVSSAGALGYRYLNGTVDDNGYSSPYDLISEHREPARVWVNQYSAEHWEYYGSKDVAIANAGPNATRIAVEFVEVVNGRDDG